MSESNRRDVLKVAAAGFATVGVLASASNADAADVKSGSKFVPTEGQLPQLTVSNGQVIIQPGYWGRKPKEFAADGWQTVICGAVGWTHFELPADWNDVLVYVESISWKENAGSPLITQLGPPDGHGGITFGRHNLSHIYLTSTVPASAQRYFGYGAGLWSAGINDSYTEDNEGGYVLKVKRNG